MGSVSNNQALKDRTVLVSSVSSELGIELEHSGARVITAPKLEIHEPDSHVALDEAIENLFGYDWIIFANIYAVDYFLRRFHQLDHDNSELDDVRVCATAWGGSTRLEGVHLHLHAIAGGH